MNHTIEKGVFAPHYYQAFQCIADKCQHSCCVDWEICIDGETYERYKAMEDVVDTIKICEDGPCFALKEDGRCPHLNDKGLCDIILTHGEEYLSEICQNHPRFFNKINSDRMEVGLGIVCEEACRLILESEEPFSLNEDGEGMPQRDRIIAAIENGGDFDETVAALREEYKIPNLYTADEWLDRFLSLEMLDAEWGRDLSVMRGKLFRNGEPSRQYGRYYKRLLTYFVYRHVSIAEDADDLRARLAFAILSVEVIRSLFEESAIQTLETLIDFARRYSAEIEYSEDNTQELIFAFTVNDRLTSKST